MKSKKAMLNIPVKTFKSWLSHDPFTQSAATAYYAIFSIPGLLIIVMTVAGLFIEQAQVEEEIMMQMTDLLGQDTADTVNKIVEKTQLDAANIWTMLMGLATMLFGATGLFVQLQRSLNHIWEVKVKKSSGLLRFLRVRITSLGLIIVIGFLLLTSLMLTTILTMLGDWLQSIVPDILMQGMVMLNIGLSLFITIVLFTLIFKILPDAKVQLRYAFYGGVLSTFLFKAGEFALNYYFKIAEPQSAFGAAGSMILLMIWVFYSCLTVLVGAEFAKTYAEEVSGKKAEPTDIAKKARHDFG